MMSITASALLIVASMTGESVAAPAASAGRIAAAMVSGVETSTGTTKPSLRSAVAVPEAWTIERMASGRPGALPLMYGTLGVLQGLDIYSTRRALGGGAHEANPLMRPAAGSSGTMLAAKVLSTAGTIYFAERMWKKNRTGAVLLMAVINGATGAIAMRNMRNAR
jgi:hypothetical protein